MTKLTQPVAELIDAAEAVLLDARAPIVGWDRLRDAVDAARDHLGQQAAAPTLEAVALAIESALPYSTGARTGWQEVTPERREMVMAAARAVLALPIQQAVAPQDEDDNPRGLPWRVAPWGDGSTPTGHANIISDAWQVTIASELLGETAEFIVSVANASRGQQAAAPGVEKMRAALELARDALRSHNGPHNTIVVVEAALAVAPPPVGSGQRSNAEIAAHLTKLADQIVDGNYGWSSPENWTDVKAMREAAAALSTPPVRGGK